MQLHFKELGSGPPLVMLHGLFGSSDNWLGVATRLAQRFRLVLVDLPNHGASPHADQMSYASMAAALAALMDAQKLERAHVLGHSLGGKTAMRFALDFSARVEKLVVVDVAPRAYPPDHLPIFSALLALDLKKFHSRRQIEEALAPEIPDLVLRRFLLKNLKLIPPVSFEWKINLRGLFQNYPALCEALVADNSFPGAALFLRGGRSGYVADADVPQIQKLFPLARIETIASAGHWVHADAPDDFVREVLEFLA